MFSFEINFGILKCADAGGVKDQTDKSFLKIDCLLVEAFGSKGKKRCWLLTIFSFVDTLLLINLIFQLISSASNSNDPTDRLLFLVLFLSFHAAKNTILLSF